MACIKFMDSIMSTLIAFINQTLSLKQFFPFACRWDGFSYLTKNT